VTPRIYRPASRATTAVSSSSANGLGRTAPASAPSSSSILLEPVKRATGTAFPCSRTSRRKRRPSWAPTWTSRRTTSTWGYASALAGLWSDLSRTLARLEAIAGDPEERLEDALETLPPLQYALHRASELVVGIEPPPGAEVAHAELAAALEDARDATAEVL